MSAPAIGLRPRVAPRQASVDWSAPLAQGLVFCVAGDEPVDVVSGNRGSQQTAPGLGSTRFGGALATSSTTAGTWHFPNTAAVQTIGTRFTVAWFGNITVQAADSTLICVPTTALWANPFANICLRRQSSNTTIQLGFSGFESATKDFQVTSAWSLGEHNYVFTRDGATCNGYDNGLRIGTDATRSTASMDWTTPQPVALLGRWGTAQNDGVGAAVSFAALWNRPLSAVEVAMLQADPFQMLRS